jgi:hypothetical protein
MTQPLGSAAVVVITGIMASGRSTVAQLLAERLPRSVHVRGDVLRTMIVSGRQEASPGRGPRRGPGPSAGSTRSGSRGEPGALSPGPANGLSR